MVILTDTIPHQQRVKVLSCVICDLLSHGWSFTMEITYLDTQCTVTIPGQRVHAHFLVDDLISAEECALYPYMLDIPIGCNIHRHRPTQNLLESLRHYITEGYTGGYITIMNNSIAEDAGGGKRTFRIKFVDSSIDPHFDKILMVFPQDNLREVNRRLRRYYKYAPYLR